MGARSGAPEATSRVAGPRSVLTPASVRRAPRKPNRIGSSTGFSCLECLANLYRNIEAIFKAQNYLALRNPRTPSIHTHCVSQVSVSSKLLAPGPHDGRSKHNEWSIECILQPVKYYVERTQKIRCASAARPRSTELADNSTLENPTLSFGGLLRLTTVL